MSITMSAEQEIVDFIASGTTPETICSGLSSKMSWSFWPTTID